jgi:hypothetical protein
MQELAAWIERLKATKNRLQLFALLDQFRVLEWTDEQRSSIAKLYMRLLDVLPDGEPVAAITPTAPASAASRPQTASEEDEEVWYEKM